MLYRLARPLSLYSQGSAWITVILLSLWRSGRSPSTRAAEERAAMKGRAAELRAEGKKGTKRADGLSAVLDSIAKMAPDDRARAERVHGVLTVNAAELAPKAWYEMPAYANADGKVVVCFKNAGQ